MAGVSGGGTGVSGTSGSGTGVSGKSGNGSGVDGNSDSSTGVTGNSNGFHGVHGSSKYIGVYGIASGDSTTKPIGPPTGVFGIYSATGTDPDGYGVYGYAQKGTALYANGNAQVTGTLSKAGGSFIIDHPLDPAHNTSTTPSSSRPT